MLHNKHNSVKPTFHFKKKDCYIYTFDYSFLQQQMQKKSVKTTIYTFNGNQIQHNDTMYID